MSNIKIYLGDFRNQSGEITIGDPCYNRSSELVINKVVAQQGTWKAYLLIDKTTAERQSLFVHHGDYPVKSNAVMGHLFMRVAVAVGNCVFMTVDTGVKKPLCRKNSWAM